MTKDSVPVRSILATFALLISVSAQAAPIYITSATFEWPGGDPVAAAEAEAAGNIAGLGTDDLDLGIGIRGSAPNNLTFTGVTGTGSLPTGNFNAGSLSIFNGAIAFNQNRAFTRDVVLRVTGTECIDDPVLGQICTPTAVGDVLLALTITRNTSDPVASADGICITVASGDEQCAWQFEQTTQTFDIIGAFGSFTVNSIIPTSPGAFVTVGRIPTQNIIRSVPVPEPSVLSLLGIGFLMAAVTRQRRRRRQLL